MWTCPPFPPDTIGTGGTFEPIVKTATLTAQHLKPIRQPGPPLWHRCTSGTENKLNELIKRPILPLWSSAWERAGDALLSPRRANNNRGAAACLNHLAHFLLWAPWSLQQLHSHHFHWQKPSKCGESWTRQPRPPAGTTTVWFGLLVVVNSIEQVR